MKFAAAIARSVPHAISPTQPMASAPAWDIGAGVPAHGVKQAADLLKRLFRGFDGKLALRLWDGTPLRLGKAAHDELQPVFTLMCRTPKVVRSIVLGRDPLRLAEAYFRGDIDIEGDFFQALGLKDHLLAIRLSARDRLSAMFAALRLPTAKGSWPSPRPADSPTLHGRSVTAHSKTENRDAIAFHYDVSNEFYALWLGEAMVYSCAYFDVTLSTHQLRLARDRIGKAGLEDRVSVELRDYRDLHGDCVYDKVSSVGMFEHVGLKNLPLYFGTVHRLLKPGGLFLNHGITHEAEGWSKTLSTEFINRYIFPDGQIADVESLRPHYALTLRHWVSRLEQHHAEALRYVSESTYRIWRLYMAACALEFESGEIGVHQILASKRAAGLTSLPLTRQHLYPRADS